MSVEPKICNKKDLDKLTSKYVDEKMSTVDIERESENIFGYYVSRGTIYKTLKRNDISVRS